MQNRLEVWRYSHTWKKWVRDIYKDSDEAQRRYESLLRKGKKAKAPRPFTSKFPMMDRVRFAVHLAMCRAKAMVNIQEKET